MNSQQTGSKDDSNGDSYRLLEPKGVWDVFALLSSIPRPSYKEEAVISALQERCEEHGWLTQVDSGGNLIVSVPATKGYEDVPSIILQGHVDIVAIKTDDKEHNFETDPITLVIDEHQGKQIVRADRTTLGADNGIGVALALAAAEDKDAPHGPLELLMTVNEESGMTGADDIDPNDLHSKYMINLDTEEDHVIYNGCVGGLAFEAVWNVESKPVPDGLIYGEIKVDGLLGGHSGLEIHQNRGNAIKILSKAIQAMGLDTIHVAHLTAGTFTNAIPAKAAAGLFVSNGDGEKFEAALKEVKAEFKKNIGQNADELELYWVESKPEVETCFDYSEFLPVLKTIDELPFGVLAMMDNGEDLESSTNLAIVKTNDSKVSIKCSIRSLIKTKLFEYGEQFTKIAETNNGSAETRFSYPPWEPLQDSELLTLVKNTHREVFEMDAKIGVIHGGLECGILSNKLQDTQMISIGPHIEGAHTPKELVYVESVEKNYRLLKAILKNAKKLV